MVTQKDIADKLGLTRTTVARALSGGTVSEETRLRVCEEAERMGYVRNSAAAGLATKRARVVYAFIIATVDESYGEQMTNGIREVSQLWKSYSFEVRPVRTDITCPGDQCAHQRVSFLEVLRHEQVDGVIFSALCRENLELAERECAQRGIPLMTLDTIYPCKKLCHVGPDYFRLGTYSAAFMAGLMMQRGRIFTMSYDDGYELGSERMRGFLDKLSTYPDIECRNITLDRMSEESYTPALERAFDEFDPIAVYAPYHVDYVGRFLKRRGLEHKVITISNGVNREVEEYLYDGTVNGIVSARPYFLGAVAANNFFKYFYRPSELLRGEIDVACDIYIRENYNRYDRFY